MAEAQREVEIITNAAGDTYEYYPAEGRGVRVGTGPSPITPQPKAGLGESVSIELSKDVPTEDKPPVVVEGADTAAAVAPEKPSPTVQVEKDTKVPIPLTDTSVEIKTLRRPVQADLERRVQQQEPRTLESVVADLKAGNPVTLGPTTIPPELASSIETDKRTRNEVEGLLTLFGEPEMKTTDAPMIGFMDPSATTQVVPSDVTDPDELDAVDTYTEGRAAVESLLRPVVKDVNVRQIFVDEFSTGDFYDNLMTRFAETERGLIGIPGYLGSAGVAAYNAYRASKDKGTTFSEEWTARSGEIQRLNDKYLDFLDRNSDFFINAPSAARFFNEEVRRIAKQRLDNETISVEQYNSIVFDEVGGQRILKDHVDEETAQGLIDVAFDKMSRLEQYGAIAFENLVPIAPALNAGKALKASKELRKLDKIKAENPGLMNGVKDYKTAFEIIKEQGIKHNINEDLLTFGIKQGAIKTQLKALSKQRKSAGQKLDDMRLRGISENSTEFKIAMSDYTNLRNLQYRSVISNEIMPLVTPGLKDTLIISGGQWAGRQYLTGAFGMEPQTAEIAGMLPMLVGGTRLTKYLGSKVGSGAKAFTGFAGDRALRPLSSSKFGTVTGMNFLAYTYNKTKNFVTLGDTSLADYEELVFRPMNGRAMNMSERAEVNSAMKYLGNLDDAQKEMLGSSLQGYVDLQDRILKAFPEGAARMQAQKDFQISFGEASGLAPLASMRAKALGELDMRKTKGFNLSPVFDLNKEMRRQVTQAKTALDNFENNLLQNGDAKKIGPVRELIEQTRNVLAQNEIDIEEGFNEISDVLTRYEKIAVSNLGIPLSSDYVDNVISLKTKLKEEELGRVLTQIEEEKIIRDTAEAWSEGMSKRIDNIERLRGDKIAHEVQTKAALEDLVDGQLELLTAQADIPYNAVRAFQVGRPGVDISPAVERMMAISGESDIMKLFGPNAPFLSGALGRKAQKVFDGMIQRAYDSIGPDTKEALEALLIDPKIGGMDPTAVANMDPLEFALMAQKHGGLNIFGSVTLDEVDVMRRAFRDYGYKVNKPEVSKQFQQWADTMDEIVESQDAEGFAMLLKARKGYQDLIGDTQRQGGTFARIKASRKGGEKVSSNPNDPYRFFYSNDGPDLIVTGLIDAMETIVRSPSGKSTEKARGIVVSKVAELTTQFGQRIIGADGKPTGQVAFDLRTPEGRNSYEMISKIVEESLFDRWGAEFIEAMGRRKARRLNVTPGMASEFRRSEELSIASRPSTIPIIRPDGTPDNVPLIKMDEFYARETDIVADIERGGEILDRFEKFKPEMQMAVDSVKNQAKIDLKAERATVEQLKILTNTTTPRDFYERFVTGTEDLDVIRTLYVETAKKQGIKAADAEKVFDKSVTSLAYRGILDKGGYSVTKEPGLIKGLNGEEFAQKRFMNTEELVQDFNNDEIFENMTKIFEPEHLEFLEDIVSFLHLQNATTVALTGAVKGMSVNEVLSRAYNISRGMVSPTYVASEFAVRLMQQSNTSALLLAAQNQDAARLMAKMLQTPKLITPDEMRNMDVFIKEFMATELVRKGNEDMSVYLDRPTNSQETTDEDDETDTQGE